MINFLHVQQADPFFETALCLEQIAYVQRLQDTVYIYFTGIDKPLQLRQQAADAVWQVIKDNSFTICEGAAPDTKNAETPNQQGSSDSASE